MSLDDTQKRSLRAPVPSSEQVSRRMSSARRRDTGPELLIRREAHKRGLRYLVDSPLPGLQRRRADMLFRGPRLAVFVDGCFWHACPEHTSIPRANRDWWERKLRLNVARDRDTDAHLRGLGWRVLRFWEHDPPNFAVDQIQSALRTKPGSC